MTMHQPRPRIICRESHHQPSPIRQECHVPSRWVVEFEFGDGAIVESSRLLLAQDVEVVSVEMDWVRYRWCSPSSVSCLGLLDDPVRPGSIRGGIQLDQVLGDWVVGVTLLDVGEDRFLPVHVNGGGVDAPVDNVLVVGSEVALPILSVDREDPGLVDECVLGHGVGNPWDQRARFMAVIWFGETSAGGFAPCCPIVAEDGCSASYVIVRAATAHFTNGTEPVFADILIGFDDDIVALTDAEKYPVSFDGCDGDQVGCHDFHLVAVKGDSDLVVDGGVDES